MRMNRKSALVAGAGMAVAFLGACSDAATGPSQSSTAFIPKSSFAISDVTPTPAPEAAVGILIVCKTGNVGGDFTFTKSTEGTTIADEYHGNSATIAAGTCLEVARDFSASGSGSHISITEAPAANTVQTITACRFRGYALDGVTLLDPEDCVYANGGDIFLNQFHGYVITYNNVFTPPTTGCTYTKGWYQNKNGAPTVTALASVPGRSADDNRAIFSATPGKPGSVTFQDNNSLLNLYQQYLAALLNGGAAGPQAVQDAIDAVAAGTGGAGTTITTTLSKADISAYTETLSGFNEGLLPGWPHCD